MEIATPDGMTALVAPMQGTIVSIEAATGDTVNAGGIVLIMEAMKMEHEIRSDVAGSIETAQRQRSATRSTKAIPSPSSSRERSTVATPTTAKRSTSNTSAPISPR